MGQMTRHVDLSTAKQSARVISAMIRAHAKVCRDCYSYRPMASRYCAEGWEMAKQLAAVKDDIRRLTPAAGGDEATLF